MKGSNYMNFIDWCNNNQGFLSFLLSCLTLLTSIIAIILSLLNYLKQYRNKLSIFSTILITGDKKENLWVDIINLSNKPLGIQQLSIVYDGCHLNCRCNNKINYRTIAPLERISLKYDLDIKIINELNGDNLSKIYSQHFKIYATDFYGKKYYCKEILPGL